MPANYIFLREHADVDIETVKMLNTCHEFLLEAVDSAPDDTTRYVVNMTSSTTYSAINTILNNIYTFLSKLYDTLLSEFNNFVLNNAKLVTKYREYIVYRFKKMKEPFIWKTYEYPFTKSKYPEIVEAKSYDNELTVIRDNIISGELDPVTIAVRVDKLLVEFGSKTANIAVNPNNIKDSTRSEMKRVYKGKPITKVITVPDIDKCLDEITSYREEQNRLRKIKRQLEAEYKELKYAHMKALKQDEKEAVTMRYLKDPKGELFRRMDTQKFATINMEMSRLLSGFITIYSEVYSSLMEIHRERIMDHRNMITALMEQTSILTTLNGKPSSGKPYKIQEELRT